jgi:hypothetical protein
MICTKPIHDCTATTPAEPFREHEPGLYHAPLCIDVVPGGCMEEIPAEWESIHEDAPVRLTRFCIGGMWFDRRAACLMTGTGHVEQQERSLDAAIADALRAMAHV